MSSNVYSRDTYTPTRSWKTTFTIGKEAKVKSVNPLTSMQTKVIKQAFRNTKRRFFVHFDVEQDTCRLDPVNIIIVGDNEELDDKNNFPGERVYSDKPGEGTKIVFGRYFTITNNLYIVPVNLQKYYWRQNLAHELTHYLFDECGITFENINEEHEYVDGFLRANQDVFY